MPPPGWHPEAGQWSSLCLPGGLILRDYRSRGRPSREILAFRNPRFPGKHPVDRGGEHVLVPPLVNCSLYLQGRLLQASGALFHAHLAFGHKVGLLGAQLAGPDPILDRLLLHGLRVTASLQPFRLLSFQLLVADDVLKVKFPAAFVFSCRQSQLLFIQRLSSSKRLRQFFCRSHFLFQCAYLLRSIRLAGKLIEVFFCQQPGGVYRLYFS